MDFKALIRDIPDFPEKGILFRDIAPLLGRADALPATLQALLHLSESPQVDKVVGMESRGFFFGPLLAANLGAGFVPVRKKGKLPGPLVSETYALEYGTDTLEMQADAIQKGDKVLIHDDVLATGGTAAATCRLVERLGGQVVQCLFLIELLTLKGAARLHERDLRSLIKY